MGKLHFLEGICFFNHVLLTMRVNLADVKKALIGGPIK